jgi:RNA recognition motif-containing protein
MLLSFALSVSDAVSDESVCTDKMEISDKKYSVKGDVNGPTSYGDIGCAFVKRKQYCAMEQISFDNTAEAHDYYSGESIRMSESFYVIESNTKTPMGYGIVAFKDIESANRFITERQKGKILTFDEIMDMDLK